MYLEFSAEKIFYRQWQVSAPVAVLLISHGLGEHSARYGHVAEFFNQQGISVYAIDHRGHGKSGGSRGHVEDFAQYSEDLHLLISQLRLQHPGLPVHVLGHSMGGLIATGYALRYDKVIASLVLSSPAYGVMGLASKASLLLAPLLALLAPTLSLSNGLDAHAISRDPAVVKAYQDDPLVHDRITATWARAFRREQGFVAREINRLRVASLMILAGSDSLTDPALSKALFEKIAADKKQLSNYRAAYHEVFNEQEQFEALEELLSWLDPKDSVA
jgi:alpha-beta hydrolase superfamily lysophospholipase